MKDRAKRNQMTVSGDIATLTIVRRSGEQVVLTIDADQVDRVQHHLWRVESRGNVVAGPKGNIVVFGPYLMKYDGKLKVTHVNRDKRDFRLTNLKVGQQPKVRLRTEPPKTGFKYVKWNPRGDRSRPYQAWIYIRTEDGRGRGRSRSIGHFRTAEDAAKAQVIAQESHDRRNPPARRTKQ